MPITEHTHTLRVTRPPSIYSLHCRSHQLPFLLSLNWPFFFSRLSVSSYREGGVTYKAGSRLIVLNVHKWIIMAVLDWCMCTHINIKHVCTEHNLTFNTFLSLYAILFTDISSFCFFFSIFLVHPLLFCPFSPWPFSMSSYSVTFPPFPFSLQSSWSSPVCRESIPGKILLTFIGGEFIPSTRLQTTPMHMQHTWVHTNSRIDKQQRPYQAIPLATGRRLETMHRFRGTTKFAGVHRDTLSFNWLTAEQSLSDPTEDIREWQQRLTLKDRMLRKAVSGIYICDLLMAEEGMKS